MTVSEILSELQAMGSASTKNTLSRHGAAEPIYGVKVEDLKKIQKRIKVDHQLSLALFDTGVSDAMYLAGLISDPPKMSKEELQRWAEKATWSMISEYAVPWAAAESRYGMELGLKWIDSKQEKIVCTGWTTLSNIVLLKPDNELDVKLLESLIERVTKTIHEAPDRVRYVMNGFVIAAGGGVVPLKDKAIKAGKAIGKVNVNMGDTACKVPDIVGYIQKMEDKGVIGKKRKTAKC